MKKKIKKTKTWQRLTVSGAEIKPPACMDRRLMCQHHIPLLFLAAGVSTSFSRWPSLLFILFLLPNISSSSSVDTSSGYSSWGKMPERKSKQAEWKRTTSKNNYPVFINMKPSVKKDIMIIVHQLLPSLRSRSLPYTKQGEREVWKMISFNSQRSFMGQNKYHMNAGFNEIKKKK